MPQIRELFEQNREWARRIREQDPEFFARLSRRQSPEYLWIGCSDSRVPANDIVGMLPGELFVHRNVANVVVPTDMNCLSVLQFAVEALRVRHVIVCGHYGCGGVRAALSRGQMGLMDGWLHPIRRIHAAHREELEAIEDGERRIDRLCELNVMGQVDSVCHTAVVQNAWARGQPLSVHGWIYSIGDGLLQDQGVRVDGPEGIDPAFRLSP